MRAMLSPLQQVPLVSGAASLYNFCVYGGVINSWALADVVAAYVTLGFVVLWAWHDSRETGYWPAFDYGLLLLISAPVAIPFHIFRTRGLAGAPLLLGLVAALLAPLAAAYLGGYFYDVLPDLRW